MRIMHIGAACHFTEGMTYQDNMLTEQNLRDGHEVLYVSDNHKFIDGVLTEVPPEKKILENGMHLIRLPYHRYINDYVSGKLQRLDGLYPIIVKFRPDVILYHGVCGYELLTVSHYKEEHPAVKLYVDSHEDFCNSGRNLLSRVVLYRMYNRRLVHQALPYIDRVLFVSYDASLFLKKMYQLPDDIMEFYPLGGIIPDEAGRARSRKDKRTEIGAAEDDLLIVHSGKMDRTKKTLDVLRAFRAAQNGKLHLAIIGSFSDDIRDEAMELIGQDPNIRYVGWKSGDEMMEYLCAADLYIQPGTQSATMQNAACCGAALALYPYSSHQYLFHHAVFYVENEADMEVLLKKAAADPGILEEKRKQSFAVAEETLDYVKLAARLYQE